MFPSLPSIEFGDVGRITAPFSLHCHQQQTDKWVLERIIMVMHPGFIYFLFTKFRNRPSSSKRERNAFAQQVCQATPVLLFSFSAKQRPFDLLDSLTCIHCSFSFCFSPPVVFFLYLSSSINMSPLLNLHFGWGGLVVNGEVTSYLEDFGL